MIPHISIEATILNLLAMSDATITVLVAAIPLTITSIAGLIVSIRNSAKVDRTIEKTNEIGQKVDGFQSKLQADLAQANGRIEQLLRFYPTPVPIGAAAEAMPLGRQTDDDAPAKVEIVQPEDKPVPVETKKKEK